MGMILKAAIVICLLAGMALLVVGIRIRKRERITEIPSIKGVLFMACGVCLMLVFLLGGCFFLYRLSSNFQKREIFKEQMQGARQGEQRQVRAPVEEFTGKGPQLPENQGTGARRLYQMENQKVHRQKRQ